MRIVRLYGKQGCINVNSFRWVGLFRDGTSFAGDYNDLDTRLRELNDYITGTADKPKRHFLLWFKILLNGEEYTISFDNDGDAYIATPDGRMLMTEYKIRSASLIFYVDDNLLQIGFAGINTADKPDGRSILFDNLVRDNLISTDIIRV